MLMDSPQTAPADKCLWVSVVPATLPSSVQPQALEGVKEGMQVSQELQLHVVSSRGKWGPTSVFERALPCATP